MRRAVIALVLLMLCVACDDGGSGGSPSASRGPPPSEAVPVHPRPSETPPSATTTPSTTPEPALARPSVIRVAPRILAVSWSRYVGQRVSIPCQSLRRLDFTRTLVVADGARFIVSSSPDVTPCGAATSTFTVLGSTTVSLAGRAALPELLLEDDGAPLP